MRRRKGRKLDRTGGLGKCWRSQKRGRGKKKGREVRNRGAPAWIVSCDFCINLTNAVVRISVQLWDAAVFAHKQTTNPFRKHSPLDCFFSPNSLDISLSCQHTLSSLHFLPSFISILFLFFSFFSFSFLSFFMPCLSFSSSFSSPSFSLFLYIYLYLSFSPSFPTSIHYLTSFHHILKSFPPWSCYRRDGGDEMEVLYSNLKAVH